MFVSVATVRLVTAGLRSEIIIFYAFPLSQSQFNITYSIMGALTIISSAISSKTVCNPKVDLTAKYCTQHKHYFNSVAQVHPIFMLSFVDTVLSLVWIGGSIVWLRGGAKHHPHFRVGCFSVTLLTVVVIVCNRHLPTGKTGPL